MALEGRVREVGREVGAARERADAERVARTAASTGIASRTCSAAAPSMTTPSRVSSCQVPCPGEITNELPPSRAIAAWKEASVRSDGLKKRSASILPVERLAARAAAPAAPRGRAARRPPRARSRRGRGNRFIGRISARAWRSAATCASSRMNGGSRRRMCGSPLVPARMPLSSSSSTISARRPRGAQAEQEAAPWMPIDRPHLAVSRISARERRAPAPAASRTRSPRSPPRSARRPAGRRRRCVPRSPLEPRGHRALPAPRRPGSRRPSPLAVVRMSGVTP